jgi:peptidoglycan-N-acetylglucosamine deacetylase
LKHNIALILLTLGIAVISYFDFGSYYYWIILVFLLAGSSFLLILGSSVLTLNYFIKSVNKGSSNGISLTFDDGPDAMLTPKVLNILEQHNVKATFFLIGKYVEKHPELVNEIINKGHIVGSHSYSHDNKIAVFSTSKLTDDLEKGIAAIQVVIGKRSTYFRPPFGVTTPRYKRALKKVGVNSVGWSLRSMDTVAKSKEQLLNKLTSKIKQGDIVLLHDNCSITVDALPDFLSFCDEKGIVIVPLDENISIKPYA